MSAQPEQPHRDPSTPSNSPTTTNSLAIASLVLGIVGIVSAILLPLVGGPVGIVAVILGILARRHPGGRGLALGGLVTGAIAIAVSAVNSILGVLLASGQL